MKTIMLRNCNIINEKREPYYEWYFGGGGFKCLSINLSCLDDIDLLYKYYYYSKKKNCKI